MVQVVPDLPVEGPPGPDLSPSLVGFRLWKDQPTVCPLYARAVIAPDLVSGPPGGDVQDTPSRAKRAYQQSGQFSAASLSVEHLEVTPGGKGPPGAIW